MTVVVGGQARNVGKTRVTCEIIAATRDLQWTAIKLTPHQHAEMEEEHTDTGRYRQAGASHTMLLTIRPGQMRAALARIPAGHVIIESTGVMEVLNPDLFVFVEDRQNPDWKESALRFRPRANIVVEANDSATAAIEAVWSRAKREPQPDEAQRDTRD